MRCLRSTARILSGRLAGLRQCLGRKPVRHLVLAHRDFDLHAGVVDLAEHLDHPAHRLRIHRRRLGEFNRDHLPGHAVGDGVLRNQDVLAITLIFRCHQPHATLVEQPPDDGHALALEDFKHPAFWAALAVVADDAHLDPVAVQHRTHLLLRQVDVGLITFADHEAVTITVTLHLALDFTHQVGADGAAVLQRVGSDDIVLDFLKCPGGGIGRRTSFRY